MRNMVLGDILHVNNGFGWNKWVGLDHWTTAWEGFRGAWEEYLRRLCRDLGVGRHRLDTGYEQCPRKFWHVDTKID